MFEYCFNESRLNTSANFTEIVARVSLWLENFSRVSTVEKRFLQGHFLRAIKLCKELQRVKDEKPLHCEKASMKGMTSKGNTFHTMLSLCKSIKSFLDILLGSSSRWKRNENLIHDSIRTKIFSKRNLEISYVDSFTICTLELRWFLQKV